jgi:hypothetical protein
VTTGPDSDDELIRELRGVLESSDPTPADVTEFAKAALGWRRLDAELAELLGDSVLETEAEALVRSGESARRLTFRAEGLSIDLEVQREGDGIRLLGQLAPPPAAAGVEVQGAGGELVASAEADSLGRFRLSLSAGGRIRLRVDRREPPGPPVETSWLSL